MDPIRVAFQGEPGAYSEAAAIEFHGSHITTVPCHNFDDVFQEVAIGECERGILPIENSLAGSIHRNYDLLLRHDLLIIGEYQLRVRHCLLALPGVHIDQIRRVYSHPQALAQCEANLNRIGVEKISEADTAGSARLLRQLGDRQAGALASRRAAEVYELQVLRDSMEDNPANFTRFIIVARSPQDLAGRQSSTCKTSIVFSLHNRPGVLFKALSVFALRDIDLTKIESRPLPGHPWEYIFYIDFAGHIDDPTCQRALEHLKELAPFLRILGSYPRHYLHSQANDEAIPS
jgi:prephenate dehydratase